MTAPPDDTTTDLHAVIAALRAERDAGLAREAALAEALAQRNSEYGERIEQQSATIDVLKVMSASPGDPQPVFEYDGELVHVRSTFGFRFCHAIHGKFPMRPKPGSITCRAILDRRIVHIRMKRRDLVLLGGAMVPARTPHAQQKPVPVIGFLGAMLSDNPATIRNLAGFREGLSEAGYIAGRNVAIEYRWAEAHYDRLPALAADLLGRKVDVIVATGGIPSVMAARSATSTIPIVFLADSTIVTAGIVNSLARPGGNLTGFMVFGHELTPKRLELLSELVPQARVIALLVNPTKSDTEHLVRDMQEAARAKGVELPIVKAGTEGEIDAAFASLARLYVGALVVASDSFFSNRRERIVALASRDAVPTIYDWREFAVSGGLISYGISFADAYRQLGAYAGRILNGAIPADLPVQQPTKFELVINLKTAKALGLTIPQSILGRADEVIE